MNEIIMIILAIMAILLVFALLRGIYETKNYIINEIEIYDYKIENPLKILFFADFHNGNYGDDNKGLIEDINAINPDIILVSGDMLVRNNHKSVSNAVNFLNNITKKHKVIFTFGNHETKMRDKEKYGNALYDFLDSVENENLFVLNNDHIFENIRENRIKIYGLEIDKSYYRGFKRTSITKAYIEKELGIIDESKDISIMLAHSPEFFDAYCKTKVDYVLSGHNHGGIIRLPYIGGLVSTGLRPFPKYTAGIYEKNGVKMIVTKGLGSHTINFRLFNRPELMVLNFKNKK